MNCVDYFFENSHELDKDFVLGNKEILSYKKLYTDVCRLAAWIRNDIGQGQNILLLSPNNSFFIISYLAIIKSGNVCVPLNQSIENSNLDYIINKSQSSFVFCSNDIYQKYQMNIQLMSHEMFANIISDENLVLDVVDVDFDDNNDAELIYTSGSTAFPKGVRLSHKNLISNTNSIIEFLQLSASDIMEVVLPFYYCYGLSLLHTHLRIGGSIVLNNTFIFINSVLDDLKKYKCTGFAGVPSHFQILLRKSETFMKSEFPHLRYVTQAGGKLHNVFIKEFTSYFPDILFYVMYGQTEATARLSYLPPDMLEEKLGSIGRGIPGVLLKVVDPEGKPVDSGVVGEIVAKGDNIMLGYYEDSILTHQTLKNGWLYTGDIGQIDDDGYIYLLARKKEIIKVGGKRVSPKEIEEVIMSIPEIIDCTISAIDDEILGEGLKATVVAKNKEHKIDKETIRQFCSQKLVPYKVPAVIEFLDNLNINSAGKKTKSNY